MNLYAMQVDTNLEKSYINNFKKMYPETEFEFHFPQKQIYNHKKRNLKKINYSIFPGYIFLQTDEDNEYFLSHYREFRDVKGFYRILPSNSNMRPLQDRDLKIALHFIKTPIAGISKVYFNENDKIVVVEGVMAGLEGNIIKVDKKRRRAKIKLDFCENPFIIDLSFDDIGAKGNNAK